MIPGIYYVRNKYATCRLDYLEDRAWFIVRVVDTDDVKRQFVQFFGSDCDQYLSCFIQENEFGPMIPGLIGNYPGYKPW